MPVVNFQELLCTRCGPYFHSRRRWVNAHCSAGQCGGSWLVAGFAARRRWSHLLDPWMNHLPCEWMTTCLLPHNHHHHNHPDNECLDVWKLNFYSLLCELFLDNHIVRKELIQLTRVLPALRRDLWDILRLLVSAFFEFVFASKN